MLGSARPPAREQLEKIGDGDDPVAVEVLGAAHAVAPCGEHIEQVVHPDGAGVVQIVRAGIDVVNGADDELVEPESVVRLEAADELDADEMKGLASSITP